MKNNKSDIDLIAHIRAISLSDTWKDEEESKLRQLQIEKLKYEKKNLGYQLVGSKQNKAVIEFSDTGLVRYISEKGKKFKHKFRPSSEEFRFFMVLLNKRFMTYEALENALHLTTKTIQSAKKDFCRNLGIKLKDNIFFVDKGYGLVNVEIRKIS